MGASQHPDEAASHKTRIISVVAGTCIALACGTNYAYGAWAPNFAERLELTATQEEIIGNFGNIGMYAVGIPFGYLIDIKGPRWGVLLGLVLLASGYFSLHGAYDKGPGHTGVPMLSFFAFLVGVGSCSSFAAAIKVCASNWPRNRGTATAFPLSGFGLSALLFMTLGGLVFPDDTGGLLLFLSIGTVCMVFVGMFFLQTVALPGTYEAVPTAEEDEGRPGLARRDSNKMHRTHSRQSSKNSVHEGIGTATETSSLVSSPTDSGPGDIWDHSNSTSTKPESVYSSNAKSADITGLALLKSAKFYQLFIMLGLLCGVGLMTINNIGNNARELWRHFDPSKSHDFIQKRQLMHVSNLSFFSFIGRLSSGIGSDWLIHRGHSRFWTLVGSACVFSVAQVCGLTIENPNMLFFLSGLTGLGYGALFGVYPSLVADAFGPSGLAVNWGAMTLAPVVSGNFFNLAYGSILDGHSVVKGKERVCDDGRDCYSSAYWVTLLSSLVGVGWSLWCIRHEHVHRVRDRREGEREHEG